jgi:excisionase family DNA binding protein
MQSTDARVQFFYLREIAEYTRSPLATVRYWVATKKLPSVKFGRRRMVRASDLEAFVSASSSSVRTES